MRGIATTVGRAIAWLARAAALLVWLVYSFFKWLLAATIVAAVFLALFIVVANMLFGVPADVAFRALDPNSEACRAPEGWSLLAHYGNDEELAVQSEREVDWAMRLRCSIQTHAIPGYQPVDSNGAPNGPKRPLIYDLAFLEFQENGDPYLLCNEDEYEKGRCNGTAYEPGAADADAHRSQLQALLQRLSLSDKNYVVVFIHGWRNNADVGNGNVSDLRVYAAHAARFVADRCAWGDQRFCGMRVTAIFLGWRGARTDEGRIRRNFQPLANALCRTRPCFVDDVANSIASIAAIFTLFDRKPVSEAVAPAAITALQAVATQIHLQKAFRTDDLAPCESDVGVAKPPTCEGGSADASRPQARMIVFGHSLGGNLLATGLEDEVTKLVVRHKPATSVQNAQTGTADFVPAPLGNLVVLINPASEAAKWTEIQRAVWRRIAMSNLDMARLQDFEAGHAFFRDEQRPVVISATAARDWPPGGVRVTDCAELMRLAKSGNLNEDISGLLREYDAEAKRELRLIDYDWATYDLFPAFRFDFRPAASSLERFARRRPAATDAGKAPSFGRPRDPYPDLADLCTTGRTFGVAGWLAHRLGDALRVFPFMNTDIEQTHTIGQLDPPRASDDITSSRGFSGRPFGTTHELVGWDADAPAARRTVELAHGSGKKEVSLGYADVVGGDAGCPRATGWLSKARAAKRIKNSGSSAIRWDAADVAEGFRPALRFEHGFSPAHLPPITRANDPFWNLRALDNALAEHDGYLLSSFICAMQQLVLDDITDIPPVSPPSGP